MYTLMFRLNELPDLTLAKYSTLAASGVDDVLECHKSFLRLFVNRPNTSLHLFYSYDPELNDGARLSVRLLVCDTAQDDSANLAEVTQLVQSSSLSPYFKFSGEKRKDVWTKSNCFEGAAPKASSIDCLMTIEEAQTVFAASSPVASHFFPWMASLAKQASFVRQQPVGSDAPNGFYVLPDYKASDLSRLYSMMRLMAALNQPVVYRVDLYPTDRMKTLRESLPIAAIKARQSQMMGARDYVMESVERSYEELLRKLDGSPVFFMNVFCFAESAEVARAVLDAAASESMEKGAVSVGLVRGEFDAASFLKDPPWSQEFAGISQDFMLLRRKELLRTSTRVLPGYVHVDARAKDYPHRDIQSMFTLEDVVAFFQFPMLNEGEMVQLKKETAPDLIDPSDGDKAAIYLGRDPNDQKVFFEEQLLTKHAFISGVPGSGKTVTMCHLVTSLFRDGIPFMVLEPAKREYRAIMNDPECAKNVILFSPGGVTPFPLRINPFEMPVGISVGHHINRLCQVFEGAFPLEGALPFLLDRAIESVYKNTGWTSKMVRAGDEELEFPTLSMLYDQIQVELEKESYDGEIGGNLKSAIHMRIGGLLRRELGDIFDVPISTVDPGNWINLSTIVELEALGTSQANFLTLLLCVLVRESLMAKPDYDGPVRHVMFIEEAHNLIGPEANVVTGENADPKQAATAFISDMLREVRALGEGIVIADQLPTAIAPEVLKNTGLKVALRITSSDDRELLGSMMTASPMQLEGMAVATPGQALVMYEGLQKPFSVQMSNWLADEEVEGYIADPELRELQKAARRDEDLATSLWNLQDDKLGSWFGRIKYLTPWIDIQAAERASRDLAQRIDAVLDVAEDFATDDSLAADGNVAFTQGLNYGDYSGVVNAALLREGFTSFSQLSQQWKVAEETLVEKTLNWSLPNETGGKIANLALSSKKIDAILHLVNTGETSFMEPEWQVAFQFLNLRKGYAIRGLRSVLLDQKQWDDDELAAKARAKDTLGRWCRTSSIFDSNKDMGRVWSASTWMSLRDVLNRDERG